MKELEPWARDAIHTTTTIRFGSVDRLNVLLFGEVEMKMQTETENPVGRTDTTASRLTVESLPRWWRLMLWKLRGSPSCFAEVHSDAVPKEEEK